MQPTGSCGLKKGYNKQKTGKALISLPVFNDVVYFINSN